MTLKGIDVSGWQKGINLSAIRADFVIVKATGGTSFVNPECDTQFRGARAAGKRTGVYHFAHEVGCAGSAIAEADHFVDSIKGYLDGKTLLVLDFEGDNQFDSGWALTWLNRVRDRTGVKPLIYLNGGALKGVDWSAVRAADYGIWLAWYAVNTPTNGYQNYNGANIEDVTPPFPCVMWQFSSTAKLSGYAGSLDVNVFYGDGAAWDAYCRKSGATPAVVTAQSTPTTQEANMPSLDEIFNYPIPRAGGQSGTTSLRSFIAWWDANNANTRNMINGINPYVHTLVTAAVTQIVGKSVTVDPAVVQAAVSKAVASVPAPGVDPAAIAKAVNDDAAARRQNWK